MISALVPCDCFPAKSGCKNELKWVTIVLWGCLTACHNKIKGSDNNFPSASFFSFWPQQMNYEIVKQFTSYRENTVVWQQPVVCWCWICQIYFLASKIALPQSSLNSFFIKLNYPVTYQSLSVKFNTFLLALTLRSLAKFLHWQLAF